MFTILFRLVHLKRVAAVCLQAAACHSPRRGDSGFLVCVGAGGFGSCPSSWPLLALNCDTEAAQFTNNGLSERITLSPYFLKMPTPNGEAL